MQMLLHPLREALSAPLVVGDVDAIDGMGRLAKTAALTCISAPPLLRSLAEGRGVD